MNMHTNEKWYRDETWQRVVDNELSPEELGQLVAACDERPELWRCCALAFLEEQALASELKQLATQWPQPRHSMPAEAAARLSPSGHRESLEPNHPKKSLAQPHGGAHSSLLNTLALAASVLVAFLVGWQASRRFAGSGAGSSGWGVAAASGVPAVAEVQARPGRAPAPTPGATPGPTPGTTAGSAAQHVLVQENDTAAGTRQLATAVPSSSGSTVDAIQQALLRPEELLVLDRRMPKQLADLEQRGLVRIDSMEGFVPVQLKDGNTALVPVQQFDVRSIGNVY